MLSSVRVKCVLLIHMGIDDMRGWTRLSSGEVAPGEAPEGISSCTVPDDVGVIGETGIVPGWRFGPSVGVTDRNRRLSWNALPFQAANLHCRRVGRCVWA